MMFTSYEQACLYTQYINMIKYIPIKAWFLITIPQIGKASSLKKFEHWTMYENKLHEHYYTLK